MTSWKRQEVPNSLLRNRSLRDITLIQVSSDKLELQCEPDYAEINLQLIQPLVN